MIFRVMKGRTIDGVSETTRYLVCICSAFLKNLIKFVRSTAKQLMSQLSAFFWTHWLEDLCTKINGILSNVFDFVDHMCLQFVGYMNQLINNSISASDANQYIDKLEVKADNKVKDFVKSTEARVANSIVDYVTRKTKEVIYSQLKKNKIDGSKITGGRKYFGSSSNH